MSVNHRLPRDAKDGMKDCPLCHGTGTEPDLSDEGVASYFQKWVPCSNGCVDGRVPTWWSKPAPVRPRFLR